MLIGTIFKAILKNSESIKIIIIILLIVWGSSQRKYKTKYFKALINQEQKYEQLSAHAASLKIKYKKSNHLQNVIESKFKKESGKFEGSPKMISNVKFSTSDEERKSPIMDKSTIHEATHEIRLKGGPPLGFVTIYKTGKIGSKVYNHDIIVDTAASKDKKTGRYTVIAKAHIVLTEKPKVAESESWVGKAHPLNIKAGTVLIDPVEEIPNVNRFQWWAPQIHLGANSDASPVISYSLSGWGISKTNLNYKILHIDGAFKNDILNVGIMPVTFRPVRFLQNTFVGLGRTIKGEYYLGIRVGL